MDIAQRAHLTGLVAELDVIRQGRLRSGAETPGARELEITSEILRIATQPPKEVPGAAGHPDVVVRRLESNVGKKTTEINIRITESEITPEGEAGSGDGDRVLCEGLWRAYRDYCIGVSDDRAKECQALYQMICDLGCSAYPD
jgi:hypothetical protein